MEELRSQMALSRTSLPVGELVTKILAAISSYGRANQIPRGFSTVRHSSDAALQKYMQMAKQQWFTRS
jgi:hypothetical protein